MQLSMMSTEGHLLAVSVDDDDEYDDDQQQYAAAQYDQQYAPPSQRRLVFKAHLPSTDASWALQQLLLLLLLQRTL